MKTARLVPFTPSPRSPPPPPHPPPLPPQTPSPPRPLAPVLCRHLQAAALGSWRRLETWLVGVEGTAHSLSLPVAATSPSVWMMTASAPQTCSSARARVDARAGTFFEVNMSGFNLLSCSWSNAAIIRFHATTPGSGPGWSLKCTGAGRREKSTVFVIRTVKKCDGVFLA